MTPRSEIVWIDIAMTTDQIRERVNRNPHSLYPVADGEALDKLVGVVYLKRPLPAPRRTRLQPLQNAPAGQVLP